MSDEIPVAESEIESERLPWCLVVPLRGYPDDLDIVGPFASYEEAKDWLENYYNGRGEARCMISPALERAVRQEDEDWFKRLFGSCVSFKKPPGNGPTATRHGTI